MWKIIYLINLQYLNKQYTLSPQKNIRESINQLVEAQMKIQMLANVRKDYMIRPLDKPFRPNEKSGPFIGLFISIKLFKIKYLYNILSKSYFSFINF